MFGDKPDTEVMKGSPEADEALGYTPETADEDGEPEGPETDAGNPSDGNEPAPTDGAEPRQGERLYGGKYKSVEELEQGYQNLQELYGRHTQEVSAARQDAIMEYLRSQGYQIPVPNNAPMSGQYGNAQMPMYTGQAGVSPTQMPMHPGAFGGQMPMQPGPYNGQMLGQPGSSNPSPYQQQPGMQQPPATPQKAPDKQDQPENPEEWMDRFYAEGPKVIREMLNAELERQGAVLGQSLQQMLQPMVQTTQQLQKQQELETWKSRLDGQIETLKANDDFQEMVPEMRALIQRNPNILYSVDPQGRPNGLEAAYQIAKIARQQQGQVTPQAKEAARLPSSTGSRVASRDNNEALVDELLGAPAQGGGVFG